MLSRLVHNLEGFLYHENHAGSRGLIAYVNEPLRGTNKLNGHDILVIGFYVRGSLGAVPHLIYVDQDGSMGESELSEVNINWRFDDRSHKWLEVDTGEELGDDGDGSFED